MDKTMVSVPVEPTQAMIDAARNFSVPGYCIAAEQWPRVWAAMLSAAPAPQPVQVEAVAWVYDFYGPQFTDNPDTAELARQEGCNVRPLIYAHPPAAQIAAPGNVEPLPRATVKLVVSLLRHRRDSLSNDAAAWLERFAALRSQEPAYGPDGSMSIHYQQDGCQMYKHPPECWSQGQAVAVGDAMVERACRAYFPGWETFHPEAWKAPRRLGMRAAITAALAQQANKEQP